MLDGKEHHGNVQFLGTPLEGGPYSREPYMTLNGTRLPAKGRV